MLEVISTLGAGFVKNLDDAFGVLPDCQPSRGFLFNFNVWRYFAGSTSCSAEKILLVDVSCFLMFPVVCALIIIRSDLFFSLNQQTSGSFQNDGSLWYVCIYIYIHVYGVESLN